MAQKQSPDVMYLEQKNLFLNILALGFHPHSLESKYRCQFDENMFNKPNKKAFEVVAHFLFMKLDHKQAEVLFRTCFPATDKKATQEFRKVCFNWLKRISEENPQFGFPRVNTTVLISPGGREFVHLMFLFSNLVLFKLTSAMKPNGLLLPPQIMHKSRSLARAQMNTLQTMTIQEFDRNQKQAQLIKLTDEELQTLADKLLNDYHAVNKKKKLWQQKKRQSIDDPNVYSESKRAEIRKQQKEELGGSITALRLKWNRISATVENSKHHKEVLNSVVCNEKNKCILDGSKLQPNVPAKLLDECQEEIYQKIGTSLYEEGKVNLASLLALANISFALVTEVLLEVGLPNFDKQNSFLSTQIKICRNQMAKLFDVKREMELKINDVTTATEYYESKLDKIYEGYAMPINSEKPSTSTLDSLFSGDDLALYQPPNDSNQGLAEKYLLPTGNFEEKLEKIIAKSNEVEAVYIHDPLKLRNEAWDVPSQQSSAMLRSSKKKLPFTHERSYYLPSTLMRETLKQGEEQRSDAEDNFRTGRAKVRTCQTPDGKKKKSVAENCLSKSCGRKSMSLPCSPSQRTHEMDGNVTIERISRSPDAEQKLICQIVKSTMQDDDDLASPQIVYEADTKSQLDRTAFVTLDKIARTPPTRSVNLSSISLQENKSGRLTTRSGSPSFRSSGPLTGSNSSRRGSSPLVNRSSLTVHRTPSSAQPASHPTTPIGSFSFPLKRDTIIEETEDSTHESDRSKYSNLHLMDSNAPDISQSSAIDVAIASILDEDVPWIMDTSTPFLEELDTPDQCDESLVNEKENHRVPTTTTLVLLDDEITDVQATVAQPATAEMVTSAIDLLMSTPPPLLDGWEEGEVFSSITSMVPSTTIIDAQTSAMSDQRSSLPTVQLNLLPTSELTTNLATPDFQRFRSVINHRSSKK